jgi:hypothetical protein
MNPSDAQSSVMLPVVPFKGAIEVPFEVLIIISD